MEDDPDDRPARRQAWPGGLYRLGHEPREPRLPADEALVALRVLVERAWRLTGRPLPEYVRRDMPGRMIRGRH